MSGNTRYRPACSLWPCGTCTRWTPSRGFTVSSSVPPPPRFSQRDNNVGPVKHFLSALLSFHLKEFFSFVFFLVCSSLRRRPRLACNLSVGFSPVAVGTPVAQRPPHRSARAALPHAATTADAGRRSVSRDTGEEFWEVGAIARRKQQGVSTTSGFSGYGNATPATNVCSPPAENSED